MTLERREFPAGTAAATELSLPLRLVAAADPDQNPLAGSVVETFHQCLLFHSHYGYTDVLSFEQRMRDVIGLEISAGTAEVRKLIVARQLMGREAVG